MENNRQTSKLNEQENTISMLMDQTKKKDLDIEALRKELADKGSVSKIETTEKKQPQNDKENLSKGQQGK